MSPLFAIGIELKYAHSNRWSATVNYLTDEHAQPTRISGSIGPHYVLELQESIDLAKACAEAIGVTFRDPALFVEDDGARPERMPANWREQIKAQSDRLGWKFLYEPQPTPKSSRGMTL